MTRKMKPSLHVVPPPAPSGNHPAFTAQKLGEHGTNLWNRILGEFNIDDAQVENCWP